MPMPQPILLPLVTSASAAARALDADVDAQMAFTIAEIEAACEALRDRTGIPDLMHSIQLDLIDLLRQMRRAAAVVPVAQPVVALTLPTVAEAALVAAEPVAVATPISGYEVSDEALAEFASFGGKTWSRYQRAVFHWTKYGTGSAQVSAVAGSGKTTSIIAAAQFMRGRTLFCAFNTHIKREIEARLNGSARTDLAVKTIHATGFAALAKDAESRGRKIGRVTEDKYGDYVDQEMQPLLTRLHIVGGRDGSAVETIREALAELVGGKSRVRVNLVDPRNTDAMHALLEDYQITLEPAWEAEVFRSCERILDRGVDDWTRAGIFDFTDMIWLPCALDLPMPSTYAWVIVDEAQDLSRAQQEIVARSLAPAGGRLLAVGDAKQAIYRFAGADAASFERLGQRFACVHLPLSICYRCPTSVIALAREDCDYLEAAPNAPAGEVRYVGESAMMRELVTDDLVLCRLTAPLVSLCMRLLAEGKTARVRGRDIGEQIAKKVKDVGRLYTEMHGGEPMPWPEFGKALADYEQVLTAKLSTKKNAEGAITTLQDTCEALRTIYETWHAQSAEALIGQVNSLFYDEANQREKPGINLSTVHKAKGLEAERVFIYRPETLPLVRCGQTPEDEQQEKNLRYVARTRAMRVLTVVGDAPDPADGKEDEEGEDEGEQESVALA